jgi:hypothetical protein
MADDGSLHLSDPLPFPRQFRSKVDWWLAVLLIAPVVLLGAFLVAGVSEPWVLVLTLTPQALVIWILARTFYVVDEDSLLVRSGPFRWTIPLASVRSLSATRNPLSSPALSLDRIAVDHAGGRLLLSPRNKAGFVRAILAIAPGVMVTGLPGADASGPADPPESSLSMAAVIPLVLIGAAGLGFGSWVLYAGTRPPDATISGDTLAISGLYSTTVRRQDVVRIALQEHVAIGRKHQGFGGGRYLRGYFDVDGLGRSRVFVSRDSTPFLIIHTTSQPLVLNFDDAGRTEALHEDLRKAWGLAR